MFSGGKLSLGVWFNLGAGGGRGAAAAPLGRRRAGAPPCAAPGGGFAGVRESAPGHVRCQRAGVTSEAPVGLS